MILPDDLALHFTDEGHGAPLVLIHAHGMDLHMWDAVLPLLPDGLRVIRVDLRGHGQSPVPPGDYFMGDMVADVGRVLDRLKVRDAVVCGMSLGGFVAQGLAAERLDLVRGLILSGSATKIGTEQMWLDRIAAIRREGVEPLAKAMVAKWFPPGFRNSPAARAVHDRLLATPVEAYLGGCAALAGTDLYESTARLRLPTLAIVGSADAVTPPDLVRETAGLIPGAKFQMIRGAGHLPCIDKPAEFASLVTTFLKEIGHV